MESLVPDRRVDGSGRGEAAWTAPLDVNGSSSVGENVRWLVSGSAATALGEEDWASSLPVRSGSTALGLVSATSVVTRSLARMAGFARVTEGAVAPLAIALALAGPPQVSGTVNPRGGIPRGTRVLSSTLASPEFYRTPVSASSADFPIQEAAVTRPISGLEKLVEIARCQAEQPDPDREQLEASLADYVAADPNAYALLKDWFASAERPDHRTAEMITRALGSVETVAAEPRIQLLTELLAHSLGSVRYLASMGLAALSDSRSIEPLSAAVTKSTGEVQRLIAHAMEYLSSDS